MDRAAALELLEDHRDEALRVLVGVLEDLTRGASHVADRRRHPELAALRLGKLGGLHPLLGDANLHAVSRFFATYNLVNAPVDDAEHRLIAANPVDDD